MGDQYNRIVQNVEQNPSPAGFLEALQEVQKELAALHEQADLTAAQTRNLESAQNSLQQAADKTSQPQPPAGEIKAALKDAKETMDVLSGSIVSAAKLGALLGNLILLAGRVFGAF